MKNKILSILETHIVDSYNFLIYRDILGEVKICEPLTLKLLSIY